MDIIWYHLISLDIYIYIQDMYRLFHMVLGSAADQNNCRRSCGKHSWKLMPLWEIVSPFGRAFSPFGQVSSPLKNGLGMAWQQYIGRNYVVPKKVVLVQNLFIGQKAEIKPTLEEAGLLR